MTGYSNLQCRELDHRAIDEFGMPSLLLMEHASIGAAQLALTVVALEPSKAENIRLLARAHARSDDHASAEKLFRQAIEADPEFGPAHRGLGRALIALGRDDEAVAPFERARQLKRAKQ